MESGFGEIEICRGWLPFEEVVWGAVQGEADFFDGVETEGTGVDGEESLSLIFC